MSLSLWGKMMNEPDRNKPNGNPLYLYLRAKFGVPDEWRWFQFSSSPEDAPPGFVRFVGAIAPVKRKGGRNWKLRDKSTERTLFVEIADRDRWMAQEAERLGICEPCWGMGQVWASSGREGTKFRTCPKCKGSGKPEQLEFVG